MRSSEDLKKIASQVRRDIVKMVTVAKSGHPGGSMSCADFLTALYFNVMDTDPAKWTRDGKNQDVFFLSAGHLTPVYYSLLARTGFFPVSELATFRKFGTRLQGHPSVEKGLPGITQTSGSLGQGLSAAIGVALAKKLDKDPKSVYVMCGDGESEEGQIWEAGMFAASKKLSNLIAFTDYNKLQIDDTVAKVNDIAPLADKWKAFGWNVIDVADGNDVDQVSAAVKLAKANRGSEKPTMVILNTRKGCGVKWIEELGPGNHNCPISEEQAAAAIREIRGED